jgi:thiol:disulfide interchange protein DsbD
MLQSMKFGLRPFLLFVALILVLAGRAPAQFFGGDKVLVTPSLVADTTAIKGGKPFTAGVRLEMAKGWHTYWRFGGDSGAPTQIAWELPPGFTAGPIQWPLPTAHPSDGDQLTYIYENEVLLLVEITPPATLPAGDVPLKAKVRWLVCEQTCVPGSGEVALTLPVGPAQANQPELFAKWRAQIPKTGGMPFEVKWERSASEVKLHVNGLPKDFSAEFFPLPPSAEVKPGHPLVSAIADDGSRTFTVPISEGGAPDLPWEGVIATAKGGAPREGWHVSANAAPTIATTPATAAAPVSGASLVGTLWAAFLGGLILNLMPCVLPVIALKIFGFVSQASEEPRRVFRLGLAFVAGVFVFFLTLAGLVIAIKAGGGRLNWGFQFQNGYILTTLIALVFIFAMSMFGVFEVTLGSGTATKLDALSRREGYGGAFVHGLFTTLLGTSCTAPFLGSVLGYAVVQPPHIVLAIFLAIAAGMSLPYFLLTWKPAWMKYLPKPGAWMERLKQFMGFALLAVVVWLLGVVGQSRGVEALIAVCSFLLLVGLACWIFGAFRQRALAWPVVVIVLVLGWLGFLKNNLDAAPTKNDAVQSGGIAWLPFTPERLIQAVQSGRPVFIDFTADWCLNCKYNEKFVLETEPVRRAFREKKVVALKADWTNADPVITDMLKKFNRAGVPVYVIYLPGSAEPVVLPEILTQTLLLRHLAEIKG